MKIICVDTDIHKYGAPEVKEIDLIQRPDRIFKDPLGNEHKTELWVNLGDNIEINNCLKKNLKKAQRLKKIYMDQVDINVPGNHDLDTFEPERDYVKVESLMIAFEHGHLGTLWEYLKGYTYVKDNKPGCGFLKYAFAKALHFARKKHPYKLEKHTLRRITQNLTKDMDVLILGHAHPENIIEEIVFNHPENITEEIVFNGTKFVKIYILPQGRHYFRIMGDDIEYVGNHKE